MRQKGESQNGCFKKTKHAKFSLKQTFLTPWYAHVHAILRFALSPTNNIQNIVVNNKNDRAKHHLQIKYAPAPPQLQNIVTVPDTNKNSISVV